jgi:acetyl esterase/lipase
MGRSLLTLSFLFGLSGCTKFDLVNALVPSMGYLRTSDLSYGPLPAQKLDVYVPKKSRPNSTVVIFFYGGDWQNGSKDDYRFVAEALASEGFVTVMPNYRLYPTVRFPAFVYDGALAVRWTHDHIVAFRGNPHRIFLMGHSAGAHIAGLLTLDARYLRSTGLDRRSVRATVGLSGPYDFVPSPPDRAVFSMPQADTHPNADIEPINFVDGGEPPMLLVQGLGDKTVNPDNAYHLAARIRQKGGAVQLIAYPDVGHVQMILSFAAPFRWLGHALRDSARYIRDQANATGSHN